MRITALTKIAVVATAAALALTACGKSKTTTTPTGTNSAGGGAKTLVISTDLPLQGASHDVSDSVNKAIQLYLEQQGNKVGNYSIEFKSYDDSTAATGKWDEATCRKNAQDHVANKNEVAIMGTYNSGCAKAEVPILNQAPDGPLLMVSHANTNVGLTKDWDPGEPAKYYPTGKRSYARVVTRDDIQGPALALFAKGLNLTKCLVLNDNETYGQGVAKTFSDRAKTEGITVIDGGAWDAKQTNYTALFQKAAPQKPDCVFLGGIFDNNGGQLIKDKVQVLGDNTKVKLIGPDGFVGYPELIKEPEAEGMYMSFAGLSTDELKKNGGAAAKFIADYTAKYSKAPANYALYGVAALQVILEAISKSDGTRAGVNAAVFNPSAPITIPADKSIIGKAFTIDPATGDTDAKDITIQTKVNNAETFVKSQPVS